MHRTDYISQLAWECLSALVEVVTWETEVWTSQLKLLPLQPGPKQKLMDGCTFTLILSSVCGVSGFVLQ